MDPGVHHPKVPSGAGTAAGSSHAVEALNEAAILHFVDADLIAAGLSPLNPELAALAAGRLLLEELDRLASARADFAIESTLSGQTYATRIKAWNAAGYRIEIVFLKMGSVRLAIRRIADRVQQGGHPVPAADVQRLIDRDWHNFQMPYRPLADAWAVYDNSDHQFQRIDEGP